MENEAQRTQAIIDYLSRDDVKITTVRDMEHALNECSSPRLAIEFSAILKGLDSRGIITGIKLGWELCVYLTARFINVAPAQAEPDKIEMNDYVRVKPVNLVEPAPPTLFPGERAMYKRAICRVFKAVPERNIYAVKYPFSDLNEMVNWNWFNAEQLELVDVEALTIAENSRIPEATELVGELLVKQEGLQASLKAATQVIEDYQSTLEEIYVLCDLLKIPVCWPDVPGLQHNPHYLLAQVTKSVMSMQTKVQELKDAYRRMNTHLHDLAMLEGTTDSAEQAQRQDILRAYE